MTVNYERAVSRRYLTVRVIAISRLRISARVTPPEDVTRFLPTTVFVTLVGDLVLRTYACANLSRMKGREKGGRKE